MKDRIRIDLDQIRSWTIGVEVKHSLNHSAATMDWEQPLLFVHLRPYIGPPMGGPLSSIRAHYDSSARIEGSHPTSGVETIAPVDIDLHVERQVVVRKSRVSRLGQPVGRNTHRFLAPL
jgi:hypothetical protein